MRNEDLKDYKGIKGVVPIQGRLFIKCEVVSIKNNRLFRTVEVGENSGNMKYFDVLKIGALDNAIYKHINKGGVSGARVFKVFDYWIKYFNDEVKVKRVRSRRFLRVNVPDKVKKVKREMIKLVKVKGYKRKDGVSVRGHTRSFRKDVVESVVVRKGYSYDRIIGKGKYENKVFLNDKEVMSVDYKRISVSALNKSLYNINRSKNEAFLVDKL